MPGRIGGTCLAVLLAVAALPAPPDDPGAAPAPRAREADSLHRRGMAFLAEGTLDARLSAMTELERASLLDPGQARIWLDFGRLCLDTGHRRRGRECYLRAARVAPDDARIHAALGAAWRWEWLSSFDDSALVRARESLIRATGLESGAADAWGELAALELLRGRVDRAEAAAMRGIAADRAAWEPPIALACADYRAGAMARADSGFRRAFARLPDRLRERLDAAGGTPEVAGGAFTWHGGDPDLTTPENEAELDYLTRLGLALILFRDASGLRWDMRAELFVRYGPPGGVEVNPLSSPLAYHYERHQSEMAPNFLSYTPDPLEYPLSVQAWSYPELGIRTELWDRSLSQSFQLPVAVREDPDPRPDPARLASRADLIALDGGRGVFRAMAPGSKPVPAQGQIARFPAEGGAILVAHLITAGGPADSLHGAWAVVASDGRVLTRGSGTLSPSSCDPTGERVAQFSAAAPPGDYRVDLTVSGPGGRRGLVHLGARVAAPVPGLALSDLVMLCGLDGAGPGPDAVRIEPDMARRVRGSRPLTVYFEIDHLAAGSDGRARFAYTCSLVPVRAGKPGRRNAPVAYEASREESHEGARRRQFVTVPMRTIKEGAYDLRIEVRDRVAGTAAAAELRFVKE